MTLKTDGRTAQGEALPKFSHAAVQPVPVKGIVLDHSHGNRMLHQSPYLRRIGTAVAKSTAGRGNPHLTAELTHAPVAGVSVSTRPPLTGGLSAYPAGRARHVMVARARQPYGWPVLSVVAGISTLVRATTRSVETLVGSVKLPTIEAAWMATTPALAVSNTSPRLNDRHPCPFPLAELRRIHALITISRLISRSPLAVLPRVFSTDKRPPGGSLAELATLSLRLVRRMVDDKPVNGGEA